MDKDLETAAKQVAGNWKKFESFAWSRDRDEDSDDWAIFNISHRDADLVSQSNASVFERELSKFGSFVRIENHSHWGVGWVTALCVKVYTKKGKVTAAFKAFHELTNALANYPLLDESDHSEREYEAACENISSVVHAVGCRDEKWKVEFPQDCEPEGLTGKIFGWLWDNDQEQLENNDDGFGSYPSEESVAKALIALGYCVEVNG